MARRRHRRRSTRRPRASRTTCSTSSPTTSPATRPQRLGQVDVRLCLDGTPGLRGHRGRHPLRRRVDPRAGRRRARPARPLPRVPVPARDPGRDGHELPAQRDQREAQGGERRRGGPGAGQGVPHGAARGDGAAQGAARACAALPERRVLGRREEARRDPADGDAEAADRDPRRDRLGARHRRAADRRGGRQRARRPRHGRARDHALPADPQLRDAGPRARLRGRTGRRLGRRRARAPARGRGLRGLHPRRCRGRRGRVRHEPERDRDRSRHPRRLRLRLARRRRLDDLQGAEGPHARAARRHLRPQVRARLDAAVPPPVARLLPRAADAGLGRRPLRHRLRQHPLLLEADREAGGQVGGPPGGDPRHVGPARDPGGGEEVPRRRRGAVRVRGRLPQAPGGPRGARA